MRLPAEQRRSQLLEVALEVFAESGFHATSMDEVAARAGVTKPVLYQHFPSKRALYVELLEDMGNQLIATLLGATANTGTMRDRVTAGFGAYFHFVHEHRSAFRLLFGASIRNDDEFARVVDRVIDAIGDAISSLIDAPVSQRHRRILAHALVGMAEATSRQGLAAGADPVTPEELAAWVSELAWFGMRGLRSEDGIRTAGAPVAD